MKKAVIVLSGGLDSTTCMGMADEEGYELYPITFHYGQRHNREVEQAQKVAQYYRVAEHRIVNVRFLEEIGGSALTDSSMDIPAHSEEDDQVPNTYVPARNLIFLSLATAYAEMVEAEVIMMGVSAVDYSGYPDCRPEFIESMNETIRLATKAGMTASASAAGEEEQGIRVETPLIHMSKAETVRVGMKLGVPYDLTTSCYRGEAIACGECDSCRLRLKGFAEAGYEDPLPYQQR